MNKKHICVRTLKLSTFQLKGPNLGLSGGPVDKNPPANAGDMGSIPGLGGFHMPPGAQVLQVLKPMHLETVLGDKRTTAVRSLNTAACEESSPASTRESPCSNPVQPKMHFR